MRESSHCCDRLNPLQLADVHRLSATEHWRASRPGHIVIPTATRATLVRIRTFVKSILSFSLAIGLDASSKLAYSCRSAKTRICRYIVVGRKAQLPEWSHPPDRFLV
ncbi:hypothetical protein [Bradyrhizobium sp. WSM2793]|uniref:hypothetical protein n=1 Tax=Bradyrhizobium sp. WSM2793 TaxID=1038866 RepID=UPI0018E05E97|nr:hypothetical protein [Bradyrhizobium sp. WSM2793]